GKGFERMARSLGGADALLLETWSIPPCSLERHPPASWGNGNPGIPVLFSFTWDGSRREFPSEAALQAVRTWAHRFGVAALGVNCGRELNMETMIEIIRRYHRVTDLPLFARPNAGTPRRVDGRWVYPHTPESMAARLPELLEAGVT